ncbi:nuclear transport factor 2 family protein [Hyphomonas adhaerens]|uniref:nuclear transport factor 2 family protein n=1 Tax=Hyphomonas adhaerens TaxID=81029 RepID=UPI0023549014|nr:nuclear transport factor 2 family protein [Hyphomonas adhaerens]|tara:strand:+ start:873 stop:1235 length:363 start_codon:yes stop_codon:yes gene_type:complete
MLSRAFAEEFANDWLSAWNDRDIDRILSHYADDVVFHSPRIALVMGNDATTVRGKKALQTYWTEALSRARSLFFAIDNVLVGSDAVTILYTNHREEKVAETFIFNEDSEVGVSIATYAPA